MPPGGIERVTCLTDGTWDQNLTDCVMVCQKLPAFGNNVNVAAVTYTNESGGEILVGGTVTIPCENNYLWNTDPKGDPWVLTCGNNDVWSPITADRVPSTHCFAACFYTNNTKHMDETPTDDYSEQRNETGTDLFPIGSTANMACQDSYVLEHNLNANTTVVTCKAIAGTSGNEVGAKDSWWDDDTVECVATCPIIQPQEGEMYTYNETLLANGNYKIDSKAVKECNTTAGYYAEDWVQVNFTLCTDTGEWYLKPDVDLTKCVLSCLAPSINDTGTNIDFEGLVYDERFNPDDEHVRNNGELIMKCEKNFEFKDKSRARELKLVCENGIWSEPFFNCTMIEGPCPPDKSTSEQNQHIASMMSASVTNIILLVCCVILLAIFVCLLDFTLPRMYHMVQEATLLLALLALMPARSPTLFDSAAFCDPSSPDFDPPVLSYDECTMVSVALHYIFSVHFLSLFLEALHNYTYFTHVFTVKSCLQRPGFLLIVLGAPLLIVVPSALILWDTYTTDKTCWINYGQPVSLIIVIPLCVLSFTAIVLSEATTMVRYPHHEATNQKWKTSAASNSKGGLIISIISFFAFMCSSFAVFATNMTLYMLAGILNVLLGVMLLIWHTLGNDKARRLMVKICPCCAKCGPPMKVAPAPSDHVADVVLADENPFDLNDHSGWDNLGRDNDEGDTPEKIADDVAADMEDDDDDLELFDKVQPIVMAPKEAEIAPDDLPEEEEPDVSAEPEERKQPEKPSIEPRTSTPEPIQERPSSVASGNDEDDMT